MQGSTPPHDHPNESNGVGGWLIVRSIGRSRANPAPAPINESLAMASDGKWREADDDDALPTKKQAELTHRTLQHSSPKKCGRARPSVCAACLRAGAWGWGGRFDSIGL